MCDNKERFHSKFTSWRPYLLLSTISEALIFTVRETREGWPLLTVETKVNGDLMGTQGVGLPCRYKRLLSCLSWPHGIAQQAGQAAVLGRLSLSMCLWYSLLQLHACYKMQHARCNLVNQMFTYIFYVYAAELRLVLFVGCCAGILEQSMGATLSKNSREKNYATGTFAV
jgi:hypothetical protein